MNPASQLPDPVLLVVTSDPADVRRLQNLLVRAAQQQRLSGLPRPRVIEAPVIRVDPAYDRLRAPLVDLLSGRSDGASMSAPLLLPTDEAARRLGLGQRTVERLVAEGRINSRKVGARRYFTESDLTSYVRSLDPTGQDQANPAA